jgi:hypothetical protein
MTAKPIFLKLLKIIVGVVLIFALVRFGSFYAFPRGLYYNPSYTGPNAYLRVSGFLGGNMAVIGGDRYIDIGFTGYGSWLGKRAWILTTPNNDRWQLIPSLFELNMIRVDSQEKSNVVFKRKGVGQ